MTGQGGQFPLWHYRAKLVRVIDGDTIVVDRDKGFGDWALGEHTRLADINAPEPKGDTREAGLAATRYLRDLMAQRVSEWVYLRTKKAKRGKYGRFVARVFIETEDGLVDVCERLVRAGHAEWKEYE